MKLLITLFAILFCLTIITGCGPHFLGKPDVEPAPQVAVDVPPPQTVKINLPNWPVYAYHSKDPDIIIILSIKDSSMKAPAAFVITDEERKVAYKVPIAVPGEVKKGQ